MSLHRTHGYDMVLELSEAGLNRALGPALWELPQKEGILALPAAAGGPLGFRFEAVLNGATVDLDTSLDDGVGLTFAYIMNLTPAEGEVGFTGAIRIEHPLSIREVGATLRCAGLDFSTGVPARNIDVAFDDSLPAPLDGEEALVRSVLAEMLGGYLEEDVGLLEGENLCRVIDPGGLDPMVPTAVDLKVVSDDFGRCLALLLTTGGGEAGEREAFTDCAIATRPEAEALMMLGNGLLLERIICPRFLDLLGLAGPPEDFFEFSETEATLRDPVALDAWVNDDRVDEANLDSLRFTIADGQVQVVGGFFLSGTGWTCTVPLEGSVEPRVDAMGNPTIHTEVAAGTPDVEIEWWVWLLGALGGSIILLVIGGVVVWVTLALLDETVEESLVDTLEGLFPTPDIPAPEAPFPMEIDEIFLDDLAIYGRPVFSEEPPELAIPEAWIDGELEVSEVTGRDTQHRTLGGIAEVIKTTFEKSHYGSFRARRRLLIAPLQYHWFLDAHALEGEGTVEVGAAEIRFSVAGDRCELWIEMGDSLDASLEVTVEDTRGFIAEAQRHLTAEGRRDSMGVSGDEILMGPLVDIFLVEPHRAIDEMAALGSFAQWGTRPDESSAEGLSRVARTEAFRSALGKGMDMDLSNLPFHD